MRTVFWTGFWVFLLDQATKYMVVHWLDLRTVGRIEVLPPFLTFHMAWNNGINFGLFSSDSPWTRWILIGIALLICIGVLYWVHREAPRHAGLLAAGLVIGGALGNVVDRVLYGAVADFVNMSCCGLNNPFAFNVADVSIFLGVVLLVFLPAEKDA